MRPTVKAKLSWTTFASEEDGIARSTTGGRYLRSKSPMFGDSRATTKRTTQASLRSLRHTLATSVAVRKLASQTLESSGTPLSTLAALFATSFSTFSSYPSITSTTSTKLIYVPETADEAFFFLEADRYAGWGMDGVELHEEVHPSYWCIRREDLSNFRKSVSRAMSKGFIKEDAEGAASPTDEPCDPNMYTVNEQFIKPLTRRAGSMSWALMCHPEGLPCNLFITHAWKEGVFEFCCKVLNSWPLDAKNAYICILANPQNLDISALLVDPRYSPFALALGRAHTMLVCPNRTESIYSRLWCAYEAYIAAKMDKLIITASRPTTHLKREFCRTLIPIIVFCLTLTLLTVCIDCHPSYFGLDRASGSAVPLAILLGFTIIEQVIVVLSMYSSQAGQLRSVNVSGIACALSLVLTVVLKWKSTIICAEPPALAGLSHLARDFAANIDFILQIYFLWLCVCMSSEMDRIRHVVGNEEARELRLNYVTCKNAECHSNADRETIMQEIGEADIEVDQAVDILIKAGMFTKDLGYAAYMRVDVTGGGTQQLAWAVHGWGIWIICSVQSERVLCGAIAVAWIALLPFARRDKFAFATRSLKFIFTICIISAFLEVTKVFALYHASELEISRWNAWVARGMDAVWLVGAAITLTCSAAGMRRVALLPYIGPVVASCISLVSLHLMWRAVKRMKFSRGSYGEVWKLQQGVQHARLSSRALVASFRMEDGLYPDGTELISVDIQIDGASSWDSTDSQIRMDSKMQDVRTAP